MVGLRSYRVASVSAPGAIQSDVAINDERRRFFASRKIKFLKQREKINKDLCDRQH